jgi:Ferritin-like domain
MTNHVLRSVTPASGRRSFLKRGAFAAVAATVSSSLFERGITAFGREGREEKSGKLTKGDAALLRFAAAAEILETDFWVQYNELGGVQDSEVPGGTGNVPYTAALTKLDSDMATYIHDNTDDEFTHQNFLNAYLVSKGADPVDLEKFRTLKGSSATGSSGILRITNLMELTIDTSWWTRYRSDSKNPDFGDTFPQAVPTLAVGMHTAIPRTDADTSGDPDFLQAIANTAAFHFPTIEQGGTTLYPAMAQRATSAEVLRILISIGPTETMHFQTWSDKAGNAPPLTKVIDPVTKVSVTFPDFSNAGEDLKANLIMPEPCPFISKDLPICAVIRPTETKGIAMGVVKFLTDMGLFNGQSKEFFALLADLAEDADEARRENVHD